jgi:hypothetical protein
MPAGSLDRPLTSPTLPHIAQNIAPLRELIEKRMLEPAVRDPQVPASMRVRKIKPLPVDVIDWHRSANSAMPAD